MGAEDGHDLEDLEDGGAALRGGATAETATKTITGGRRRSRGGVRGGEGAGEEEGRGEGKREGGARGDKAGDIFNKASTTERAKEEGMGREANDTVTGMAPEGGGGRRHDKREGRSKEFG